MDNNYFSLDNLDELVEIDEHLQFVDDLTKKYDKSVRDDEPEEAPKSFWQNLKRNFMNFFSSSSKKKPPIRNLSDNENTVSQEFNWEQVRQQLDFIRKKKDDKKLNLSVIGEFSTGKSTFINALLGTELLVSSALQGTTVASTIIDYDSSYRIVLRFLDDRKERSFDFRGLSQLKNALVKYTTNASEAKQLKSVTVYLPSEILKSFRIIDTPGTNVTEAWHEDVTIRTLKDDSDLSIILISAEKLLTTTMTNFAEKTIKEILPQCVFVVTKLDLIRQRERERQVAFIKMKLEEEFELEHAVVLPFVSPVVLSDKQSGTETVKNRDDAAYEKQRYDDDSLLDISFRTEQLLVQHTAKQKSLAMAKKLALLIGSIYEVISVKMGGISDEYEKRMELLNKSKKVDLSSFVMKEKQIRISRFRSKTQAILSDFENDIYLKSESAIKNILNRLDNKDSIDDLNKYITDSLGRDCADEAKKIVGNTYTYCSRVRDKFSEEMKAYGNSFAQVYETLNIIPVNMSQLKFDLPSDINIETADIESAANYISEQMSKGGLAAFGAGAAGAAIGTAILPGVGTVAGLLIGAMIGGAAAAPKLDTVRKECKNKLDLQLQDYYEDVSDKLISAVKKYIGKIENCLSYEIDRYMARYHMEVERQIAEESRQMELISQEITSVNTDRKNMLNHKKQLESVMIQLNSLGRKEI
ncbi:MAG: dynamin family protein [Oscillospiraceae bacterium]|nr:dynamin family protein [Oscillospiraceae bacterium]